MEINIAVAIGSVLLGFLGGYAVSILIVTIDDTETSKIIDDTNKQIIELTKKNETLRRFLTENEEYIKKLRKENRELKHSNNKLTEYVARIRRSINIIDGVSLNPPTSPLVRQSQVQTDSDVTITDCESTSTSHTE